MSPSELKEAVEQQYGTVYRFCKATGLARSSVYWALSGNYPGDASRVLAKVGAALAGNDGVEQKVDPPQVFAVLEQVACAKCSKREPWRCPACRELFHAQAAAIAEIFADTE